MKVHMSTAMSNARRGLNTKQMKKILRIKKHDTIIVRIFVLLLFVVFSACQKEFYDSLEAQDNNLTVKAAKTWYEINRPEEPAFSFPEGKVKVPIKPDWLRAYTFKNSKYEVVETELSTYGMIAFSIPECMAKYIETKDMRYNQSYFRVVFRTDLQTNKTVGFLMTQVPNLAWLEKSNFKPFRNTNYLERDKNFGGWILFHNLDGSFSNGWIYENGKIKGSIKYMNIGATN